MTVSTEKRWIAGFWRRTLAYLVDVIVLAIIGNVAGHFFEDFFAQHNAWAHAIGFVIAAVYFGALNSRLANGQTLGKKWLKIRVVDAHGVAIAPLASFGRFCVYGLTYLISDTWMPSHGESWWPLYASMPLIFLFCADAYLYLFNHRTRQSLHDIAFGTSS